ncbi:MAG TPA: proline--tRNA ligase [Buchnera sp. (in: enterobacteria)]|nr:proline--tRNA ligase [Buchnera sp. (in: enterobacteria)]
MRAHNYFFCTLKEIPHDIDIISHQLMLRSGMIRKTASGIYTWLPTGLRVLRKIENIIREELNKIGAIEICMPILQPVDFWHTSKRWDTYGKELLKVIDRRNSIHILGPTHEEVVTYLVKNEVHSYKQLPLILYQIQTKFRDEIRPRCGVMRSKEFIMKDAYSFHTSTSSLKMTYYKMYQTYTQIFQRMKLKFGDVQAHNGEMGGSISHEFHAFTNNGEDKIFFPDKSDSTDTVQINYNVKKPSYSNLMSENNNNHNISITLIKKPNNLHANYIKTILVKTNKKNKYKLAGLLIKNKDIIDKYKVEKIDIISKPLTLANKEEIYHLTNSNSESVGPIGLDIPLIADSSIIHMKNFVVGANINGKYFKNVNWETDIPLPIIADIKNTKKEKTSLNKLDILNIKRSIEIGHIFQLEEQYSRKINAYILEKNGHKNFLNMGCYGIGITRIIAAIIEQNHDFRGIIWNTEIAPFQVVILPINLYKSIKVKEISEKIYKKLKEKNIEVILDDRNIHPGIMFTEMELIGIPHFIIVSDQRIHENYIEYKSRYNNQKKLIKIENVINFIVEKIKIKY